MSLFTIAFIFVGSICFALGFLHLLIYFKRRDLKDNLCFGLMALAFAFSSFLEIGTFHASSLAAHIPLLKATLVVQLILWICFTWFIHYYTKSSVIWPPIVITTLYASAFLVNLLSPGSILFKEVTDLSPFVLKSGETIYYSQGPANGWRILGDVAWFLLLGYTGYASYRCAKNENLKKAVVFASTVFLCLGLGYLHGTLIDTGVAPPPYLGSFLFLPLSLVMSYSLAGEVARASALSEEVKVAEARWRRLLENVHLLILGIDHQHNIFYVNPFFLEHTGYRWTEVVGHSIVNFIPKEDREKIKSRLDEVLHERSAIHPERSRDLIIKSGDQRKILWSNVLLSQEQTGNRTLSIGKDITDQLQAERSRDQALEELNALKVRLEQENISLREIIQVQHGFEEIIGNSDEILYVLSKIRQVAGTDSTVLIQGETGTGKELVAKAIHKESDRSKKPFIRVNCAAIPSDLFESELFGHEPGAFTGATNLRRGKFELAEGGVLFLDEIAEMPLAAQAKMLNVIQEREIERIGGSGSIAVDVQIIAATNRVLETEVKDGRFRSDLYYRLNIYPITVPPLRDRKDDITLLAKHFITVFNRQFGKNIASIPPAVLEKLENYYWPGNVRELRNLIERAIITSNSTVLNLPRELLQTLEQKPREALPTDNDLLPLSEVERRHILRALQATGWKVSGVDGAATILKINPSTLRSRIKKHDLEKP